MGIGAVFQDCRYALSHLRRSPLFSAVAVITLAVAIGANAALFSMLNALTMQRLPIPDPDGLIAIMPLSARGLPRSTPISAVEELQRSGPFSNVCGYLGGIVLPVMANGVPAQSLTTFVTGECFGAFRVQPALGRLIDNTDAPIFSAGAPVAVISHRLWEGAFQRDPNVVGKGLLVNNVGVTIVGVLPRGFTGLEIDHGIDVFTPFDAVLKASPGRRQLAGVILGRLKAGIQLSEASSQIRTIWPAILDAAVPATLAESERTSLRDSIPEIRRIGTGLSANRQKYARPLTLVMALTAGLLLIACVNLGGLLLSRLATRDIEVGIRLALGGTWWRVARQLVFESLALSVTAAILAIPLAYVFAGALSSLMPPLIVPYSMSFAPDFVVWSVTSGVGILVGIVISSLPIALLRARGRYVPASQRSIVGAGGRLRRGLIAAQVSVSVVMLCGAALLARSVYILGHSDLGITTETRLNIKLFALPSVPEKRAERAVYYSWLLDQVTAIPGVRSASLAMGFPRMTLPPSVAVRPVEDDETIIAAGSDRVSPSFFSTMGIPLLAGRAFAPSDTLQSRPVAVVSESLAAALSPDRKVIDRRIKIGSAPAEQDVVIVGVVGNATQGNPRDAASPVVYRPAQQLVVASAFNPNLLIDAADTATATTMVAEIVRTGGREYIQEAITVDRVLARAPTSERMSAAVATIVAILGVLLTLIGVYSTLAYSVARRSREIGLRVAIGASPSLVALHVVGEGFAYAVVGVLVGLPLAFAGTRYLRPLLFGVSETDVSTFAGVGVFFLMVGVAGAVVPALRAATVDPMKALTTE